MIYPEPVGSELAKLIPDWAVADKEGCYCKEWQRKMDRWGVKGCQVRRNEIVAHLLSSSSSLIPALSILPDAMKRIGANRLLSRAIVNAGK